MKRKLRILTLFFVTLCITMGVAGPANADTLLTYMGTTYQTTNVANEYLPAVTVNPASDVIINGFGVYGQAQVDGQLEWLIFDWTDGRVLEYLSAPQAISGHPGTFGSSTAQWYDSPTINFTLTKGHTYAMGVISNQFGTNSFRWGASAYYGGGTIIGTGLTMAGEFIDNSGVLAAGGAFTNTPTLWNVGADTRWNSSLRITSAPVPEPATMLLLGLGLVGVAGIRRKFKN